MTVSDWERAIDNCESVEDLKSTAGAIKFDRTLSEEEKTELRIIYFEAWEALIIMDMSLSVDDKVRQLEELGKHGKAYRRTKTDVRPVHE